MNINNKTKSISSYNIISSKDQYLNSIQFKDSDYKEALITLAKTDRFYESIKVFFAQCITFHEGLMDMKSLVKVLDEFISSEVFELFTMTRMNFLYYEEDDELHLLMENTNAHKLAAAIKSLYFGNKDTPLSSNQIDKIVNNVATSFIKQTNTFDDTIQLRNYYIKNGVAYKGVCKGGNPSYFIDRRVDTSVTKPPRVIEAVIKHLANGDKADIKVMFHQMAMTLINSQAAKKQNPTIQYFYGPKGKQGKSTFLEIYSRTFPGVTATINKLEHFSELHQAVTALVVMIDDQGRYMAEEVTTAMKQGSSGNKIAAKGMFEDIKAYRPFWVVLVASNQIVEFGDKDDTDGLPRRLYIIAPQKPLTDLGVDLLSELNYDETYDQLFSYIFNLSQKIVKEGDFYIGELDRPEMQYRRKLFLGNEASVQSFLESEDYNESNLIGLPTKHVYRNYVKYCSEIGVEKRDALSMKNFNKRIKTNLSLIDKRAGLGYCFKNTELDELYIGGLDVSEWEHVRNENLYGKAHYQQRDSYDKDLRIKVWKELDFK